MSHTYQPLRGKLCLPPDCWNLDEFDFDPLDPLPESKPDGTQPPETARKVEQGVISHHKAHRAHTQELR